LKVEASSFERIRSLVRERSAIVLEPGKEYLVETRLLPIVRARGYRSIDELCQRLHSEGADLSYEVVEAMTTNETSFFRDISPFEALKQSVLPEIIARRTNERALRIWCAACSTGQEPYSVAMTIRESFPELASWNVQILATDISRQVLDRARSGKFKQVEVNRGLSAQMMVKYFRRSGLEFEIMQQLRDMVRFEELNLVQAWPRLPAFDIVFLRNVLIYFDVETKRSITNKVRQRLSPDGYLFLGGSETLPVEDGSFERLSIPRSGCYRQTRSSL
jgi:chemotaxis protein methyltransferase CheR